MKKIFLICILVLIPSVLWAAPFLVCEPQAGVTHYKLTGPAWVPTSVAAQPDGSIRLDMAVSPQGVNALTAAACITESPWPEICSTTSPFSYARPGAPTGPSNLRLIQ